MSTPPAETPAVPVPLTPEQAEAMRAQVAAWVKGMRKSYAKQADTEKDARRKKRKIERQRRKAGRR